MHTRKMICNNYIKYTTRTKERKRKGKVQSKLNDGNKEI